MNRIAIYVLMAGTLVLVTVARQVTGQEHSDMQDAPAIHRPAETKWVDGPPSLPRGARFAVLEGDPTKDGPFTMRVKVPNGYRIPPHTHPNTERLTVISGTFRLGMGEVFDPGKLVDLPAGTYGFWPAGMKHFAAAKSETVVQLHGIGPWRINYLNSADDPRNARK